jgi:hypothetical protein
MRPIVLCIMPLLLATASALAGSIEGSSALALAALVAEHSPNVKAGNKLLLEKFLNGRVYSYGKKINVVASGITCKAGDVDITLHECDLTFGAQKITAHGRKAHELYATLAEAGVPSEGAAGSSIEALSNLDCTIDPVEVKQKAGGGAHCTYAPAK